MIAVKIGGSSVDSGAAVGRAVALVAGFRHRRPVVVVSAMGWTTRKLLAAAEAAASGDRACASHLRRELIEFHRDAASAALPPAARSIVGNEMEPFFAELGERLERIAAAGALSAREADGVAGIGELLSSLLLAAALRAAGVEAPWIDCRQVIVTDDGFTRARPLYGPTHERLRAVLLPHLEAGRVPVVGGYAGATQNGVPTTLGKEGSDFSAAIVGAALGAEEIVICTDVEGILTADPRLVPGARRVRTLSFGETLELASSGGKKPHSGTLEPAGRADVPLRIVSTANPYGEGTVVGRRAQGCKATVKSIAARPHACTLRVRVDEEELSRENARGRRAEALAAALAPVVDRFRPGLMILALGESGATLALHHAERLDEVREALGAALGGCAIETGPGIGIVSVISDDLSSYPALLTSVLAACGASASGIGVEAGRPIFLTSGVAAPVVRLPVPEERLPGVLSSLHDLLFPGSPEEVVP
jgi:aspartate kinase